MAIFKLSKALAFPPPQLAEKEGLLAFGGDLSSKRLLLAYRHGIFPWYAEDEPILWWSPDPRLVLYPSSIRVSKSLRKILRKDFYRVTLDTAFAAVIENCARIRLAKGEPTWIVQDMMTAYCQLHAEGYAHSVEAWRDEKLVGGLYGVSLGKAFFGESMFAILPNASKVALAKLTEFLIKEQFAFIDCQVPTEHLKRFGAVEIPRDTFLQELQQALRFKTLQGPWHFAK